MISLEAEETYDRMAKGTAWQEQAMFQGRKAFFLFCFFLFVFSRKVTTPEKKNASSSSFAEMVSKALLVCLFFLSLSHRSNSLGTESTTAPSLEGCGRVLAIHLPGAPSHLNLMLTVSKRLYERGHHVLLLLEQNDYGTSASMLQKAGIPVLAYDTGYTEKEWREGARSLRFSGSTSSMMTGFQVWGAQTDMILRNESLIQSIREFAPSLVLGDFTFLASTALSQVLSVPQVALSCAPLADPPHSNILSFPNPLSTVPQFGSNLTLPMTASDKVWNIFTWAKTGVFFKKVIGEVFQPVLRSHGLSMRAPTAVIVNTDWSLDWPRSLPPHVKYIGPLLASAVPEDKAALAAPFGGQPFVVASLGTLAALSATEYRTVARGLSMLSPVKVLWKVSSDDLPEGLSIRNLKEVASENVEIVERFAQNEILAGRGALGFFTHGGINSIYEAAFHGVPIVALPLIGDQLDNVNKAISKGFAERVGLPLSPENVFGPLQKILNNPVYKTNAQKLSFALQNKYLSPLDEAAAAIESVIKDQR